MSVEHHREREVTFDVEDDWVVPDLSSVAPQGGRVETAQHELAATYYDTDRSTLRLLGMTLRHREGGAGCRLAPEDPRRDARTEVQSHAAAGSLPAALRRRVAGVVGDDAVRPVATIRTTRQTTHVLDADGELLVELADDRVTGTAVGADAYPVVWREVEVELGPAGDEADLDRVTGLLDGARPATVTRKITHVLGEAPRVEPEGRPALVVAYLRAQCAAILLGDVGLRDDPTPEVVHATRVGVRRLRSTLRLFDHVVDEVPDSFDEDLGWLAGLLSPIRDADILGRRLAGSLDELEPQDVVGPVRDEIHEALRAGARDRRSRSGGGPGTTRGTAASWPRWCAGTRRCRFARTPRSGPRRPCARRRRRFAGGWPRRPTRTASTRPARPPSGCGMQATSSNPSCRGRARSPVGPRSCRRRWASTRTSPWRRTSSVGWPRRARSRTPSPTECWRTGFDREAAKIRSSVLGR